MSDVATEDRTGSPRICTCPRCSAVFSWHPDEGATLAEPEPEAETITPEDLRGAEHQHAANVKEFFAGQTLDIWHVANEGRPGERFTKIGEYRSVLVALTMANFDAKHNRSPGAEYLLCSTTGERVLKVRIVGTQIIPLEWIHPARLVRLQELELQRAGAA